MATDTTWYYWTSTDSATPVTSSCTTTTDTTWIKWTGSTTSSTGDTWHTWTNNAVTASTNTVWETWTTVNHEVVRIEASNTDMRRLHRAQPLSPAQRRQQQIDREWNAYQAELRAQEAKRERAAASARARELLFDNLTDQQRSDLKRDGFFFVPSKKAGRKYRLRKGRAGNVDVIQNERILHRLCAHPQLYVPDDDTRLAQKLMIEHQEDEFLRLANVHPAR